MITNIIVTYLLVGVLVSVWAWLAGGRHERSHPRHPLLTCIALVLLYPLAFWLAWRSDKH